MHISGKVVAGFGVASGRDPESPYEAGTIAMQTPFFRALGLDLSHCFMGTINLSLAPRTLSIRHADFHFHQVAWTDACPPEDFSFVGCELLYEGQPYVGYLYHPHPDTKPDHHQPPSVVEVICEPVPGLSVGDVIELLVAEGKVTVSPAGAG